MNSLSIDLDTAGPIRPFGLAAAFWLGADPNSEKGTMLPADGQLAAMPSVLFDAVAVILSDEGAKALSKESAAIDFVRDAF
ncbi:MAG TPA: hypothetical protein VLT81_15895, partial [Chondromyces sp.]|nr:hypothetical protein [Chondromyces sp.]